MAFKDKGADGAWLNVDHPRGDFSHCGDSLGGAFPAAMICRVALGAADERRGGGVLAVRQLEIANFTVQIPRVSGTLKRCLKKQEIKRGIRKTRRQIRSRRSPTPDRSVRLRSGANGDYPLRRRATPGQATSPAS